MTPYGLRGTVDDGEEYEPEVNKFVQRVFFVDDGLVLQPTAEEVVTLIRNMQATLASANLRLHKVVPDYVITMKALSYGGLGERHSKLRFEPRQLAVAVFVPRILELGDRRIYLQGIRSR